MHHRFATGTRRSEAGGQADDSLLLPRRERPISVWNRTIVQAEYARSSLAGMLADPHEVRIGRRCDRPPRPSTVGSRSAVWQRIRTPVTTVAAEAGPLMPDLAAPID